MIRLIIRFWPVLLPLTIYVIWFLLAKRKAEKAGEELPKFTEGPWFWILISSLLIAIACFVLWWVETPSQDGVYVPAHMENGQLIHGKIVPEK